MSNTDLIIEERSRDIGDFLVGRLIPFRKKRMVGPFIFIYHMGPSNVGPGKYLDVDQHPHIGLCTLTYLFDGEITHADSIGTIQNITPGSVNLMVAGRGVRHTERTPEALRDGQVLSLHGFQIWIALPRDLEQMEPEFQHVDADQLPHWNEGGNEFRLIAGSGFGRTSSVKTYSDLFMVEIKAFSTMEIDLKGELKGEIGVCIVKGSVTACDQQIEKGNMLVSKVEDACSLTVSKDSHLRLIGGEPFEEKRYIFWNFVSSDKEILEQAKTKWKNRGFPKTPNDDTYVPMP